tara:strand:- start:13 stop:228 length:216 start_codon:yes stop_codon:yes gene_type:complete
MVDKTIETYPSNWDGDADKVTQSIIALTSAEVTAKAKGEAITRLKAYDSSTGDLASVRAVLDDIIKAIDIT